MEQAEVKKVLETLGQGGSWKLRLTLNAPADPEVANWLLGMSERTGQIELSTDDITRLRQALRWKSSRDDIRFVVTPTRNFCREFFVSCMSNALETLEVIET